MKQIHSIENDPWEQGLASASPSAECVLWLPDSFMLHVYCKVTLETENYHVFSHLSRGFDTGLKSEFLDLSLEEKIYFPGGMEEGLMARGWHKDFSKRDIVLATMGQAAVVLYLTSFRVFVYATAESCLKT